MLFRFVALPPLAGIFPSAPPRPDHPVSYPLGRYLCSSPEVKRPGREANHLTPCSNRLRTCRVMPELSPAHINGFMLS
jgi:hypothetical protein